MSEFLSVGCPTCHRIYPAGVWRKIVNSDVAYLGILQRSRGRGRFEMVKRIYQPVDLDWVALEGFNVFIRREPAPSELVKQCLVASLSRWVEEGWLTDKDLRSLGLQRLYRELQPLVHVSRTMVSVNREVKTRRVDFEV